MAIQFEEGIMALWVCYLVITLVCMLVIAVCVHRIYHFLEFETMAPIRKTVKGRPFLY